MSKRGLFSRIAAIAFALLVAASLTVLRAGQAPAGTVAVDADDIGGVVTGAQGPEAGVWVIAETRDTPTRLIKSVVTDDQGRYLVPDLPKANYDVWVRGYGLVDSPKVKAAPGKTLNLKAVAGAEHEGGGRSTTRRSTGSRCCRCRPRATSPAPGRQGNGISPNIKSQGEWIRNVVNTDGCTGCHQMGGKATREIPASFAARSKTRPTAWDRRIQAGQAGGGMSSALHAGRPRARARRCTRTGPIGSPPASCPTADAGASAGPRAQRRHHDVGLGRSEGLPARRDRERQAQSRPSTPTGRSTARSKRAPTTCRSSIRRATRRAR